ncbi:protein TASOR 2 [Latimeria chalumnae]|uniref:protein TASOR 2 n=1 Tax=Latimeria chalumnae TaxID=7897 RepID=UPI00313ABD57
MDPAHFLQQEDCQTDTLTIIIRNEDLSTHLHKVPCLLELKQLPNVTFAGIDCPEDITNYTYQELLGSGGIVVSDGTTLENLTLGQLKETMSVLETLNRIERWKWLIHYAENKKLKENARKDSVAQRKRLVLNSCQEANLVEFLSYHRCDTPSQVQQDCVACLVTLQLHNIYTRFTVYLTDQPYYVRRDLAENGIFAMNVETFIETIQKFTAPFNSTDQHC